jgi:hypothetical protein
LRSKRAYGLLSDLYGNLLVGQKLIGGQRDESRLLLGEDLSNKTFLIFLAAAVGGVAGAPGPSLRIASPTPSSTALFKLSHNSTRGTPPKCAKADPPSLDPQGVRSRTVTWLPKGIHPNTRRSRSTACSTTTTFRWGVCSTWVRFVVGERREIVVALDWTEFDSDRAGNDMLVTS